MKRLLMLFTVVCAWITAHSAQAQGLQIDIVNGNAAALPIAVVPFEYLGVSAAPETDISAVILGAPHRSC